MSIILRRAADVVADLDSVIHSLCVMQSALIIDADHEALLKNRFETARIALEDLSSVLHRVARQYEADNERQLSAVDAGRREGQDG